MDGRVKQIGKPDDLLMEPSSAFAGKTI